MIVECWGYELVRDYVILDCFVLHICNSLMESVYNHVIAECAGVTGVYYHKIARSGRSGRVENYVFMRDWSAVGRGRGLVRKYVILDSLDHHICNSLMESVYNHVIAELKPAERVENHVTARVG